MLQSRLKLLLLPLRGLPVPVRLPLHLLHPTVETLQEPVTHPLSEEVQQLLVSWTPHPTRGVGGVSGEGGHGCDGREGDRTEPGTRCGQCYLRFNSRSS